MLLVHYTKEQAVFTYNSRTIKAMEAALKRTAKNAAILGLSLPEADFPVPVRSTISSAVVLLRGATSDLATTQITGRAREIFWEKRISQEYEFTMYNWDFCDQNMSLARLVRWVPPSAALGLLIRIPVGGGESFTPVPRL